MSSQRPEERRQSPRRRHYRVARIEFGAGIHARGCRVIDISDSGVRLHVEGFDIPDEFVLLTSSDGVVRENTYKVIRRRGHQVAARFVGVLRSGFALQY
jgi:PilZ domain